MCQHHTHLIVDKEEREGIRFVIIQVADLTYFAPYPDELLYLTNNFRAYICHRKPKKNLRFALEPVKLGGSLSHSLSHFSF